MKLIVDIPYETYKDYMTDRIKTTDVLQAVRHGKPLPKGHGRIADIDKVLEEMRATRTYDILFALERVKPIIEADGGGEDVV